MIKFFMVFLFIGCFLQGMEEPRRGSVYGLREPAQVRKDLNTLAAIAQDDKKWKSLVNENKNQLIEQAAEINRDINWYQRVLYTYDVKAEAEEKFNSMKKTLIIYAAVGLPLTYLTYKYGWKLHKWIDRILVKDLFYARHNILGPLLGVQELFAVFGEYIIPTYFSYKSIKAYMEAITYHSPEAISARINRKLVDIQLLHNRMDKLKKRQAKRNNQQTFNTQKHADM